MKNLEVVAAIIIYENKILATQRGYGEFERKWEFPGGKVENKETLVQALIREVKEELEIEIEVGKCFDVVEYDYSQFHLVMHCFLCTIKSGNLILKEHKSAKWLSAVDLDSVDWLPADKEVVRKIKKVVR